MRQLAILRTDSLSGSLTAIERAALAQIRGPRRREEWMLGRLAAHELLGAQASVVTDPDGAPRIAADAARHISISHDGAWIAVAVDEAPIGIDLCTRVHASRIPNILRWLAVDADDIDPVEQWAALEAVLKLRRLSIEQLRDRALVMRSDGDAILVRGIGDDVRVTVRAEPEFVVAVCG